MKKQTNDPLLSSARPKTRQSMISIVSGNKWFKTLDGDTVYTYIPRTLSNRTAKDDLTAALRRKGVHTSVFSRKISFKKTGEKVNSYVITASSMSFSETFPDIKTTSTKVNLSANDAS